MSLKTLAAAVSGFFRSLIASRVAYIEPTESPEPVVEAPVVPAPAVLKLPRIQYTDADGTWEDDRLLNEVKIDTAGRVYFKINRVWIEQANIRSITLVRA